LANLFGANLSRAYLRGADLSRVDFQRASLVETNLSEADLTDCRIYGMSAWDLNVEGTKQNNLIITRRDQAEITVDNIEVAQFIYLLLHNKKIRDVIDTITSKAVLILAALRRSGSRCSMRCEMSCASRTYFRLFSTSRYRRAGT
jgi:uncharacterized protein YjbI with pentapeptide repeats